MLIELKGKEYDEAIAQFAEFLPAERLQVVKFTQDNSVESEFDQMMLALGQDRDYRISYIDKDNKETHICLGAMNEIDAEDRFNGMFPGNIFISAKEIQI